VNIAVVREAAIRVSVLAIGFALITTLVYTAGLTIVPLVHTTDQAILAAINPDTYFPGVDEFFRALTDYTNILLGLSLFSWIIAYGLYLLIDWIARFFCAGADKRIFTGLLIINAIVWTVLCLAGKMFPNKTYMGVNVLLVLTMATALGFTAWKFHSMDAAAMRRFARVFWLILLSVMLTDFIATNHIKETIRRPRPLNDANKPWNESVRVIPDELLRGANSFPSGHTSGTFSLITPLFWYARKRKVRAGLFTWAVLQGMSRIYTAAHFPFCCLMGGLLGFSIGTLVYFVIGGPAIPKEDAAQPAAAAA